MLFSLIFSCFLYSDNLHKPSVFQQQLMIYFDGLFQKILRLFVYFIYSYNFYYIILRKLIIIHQYNKKYIPEYLQIYCYPKSLQQYPLHLSNHQQPSLYFYNTLFSLTTIFPTPITKSKSLIYNNNMKQMGNVEWQVSQKGRRQWIQIPRSNKRILYNRITQEEFQFTTLCKVNTKCNISQIMERSIYPIQNTPRLIILQHRHKQIDILVQNKSYELKNRLIQISLVFQLLQVIREIVSTLNSLFCRYGAFKITDRMVCFSKSCRVLVWINEHFDQNIIQIPQAPCQYPQQQMLSNILRIIRENVCIKLESKLFIYPPTTFLQFLSKIDLLINQQRLTLQAKKASNLSKQPHSYRFQPRSQNKQLNLHKYIQFQQYKVKKGQEIKDRYKIPSFVKNAKFNKNKISNGEGIVSNKDWRRDKNWFNLGRVKSLNCSPQSKEAPNELRGTYRGIRSKSPHTAFEDSLGSLLFSKQSSKTPQNTNPEQPKPHKLIIPPIQNLRGKQEWVCTESSLETQSDKRVDRIGDMTFREACLNYSMPLEQLDSYCKSMSYSLELGDSSQSKEINLSIIDSKCSIIIHQGQQQSVFDGKYIQLYDEFSRILF